MSFVLIAIFALVGAPIFAVFGAVALRAYAAEGLDASLIVAELSRLATMPLLQTLPMFALAGYIIAESNASRRLVRVSRALVGWMPGGLAIVSMLILTLLTAFTGATGVTIVALGGLLLPALIAEGYSTRYSLGLIAGGGNLGVLFAPSLPLILYAVIANPVASEVSIDRMFRAGIVPGLVGLGLMAAHAAVVGRRTAASRVRFSPRELLAALWDGRWEIPLPFVVLGGIYSGKLVVSEAAVITAAYALIVETLLYREVRLRDLARIVRNSMVLVGGVLLILGMGMAVTNYLVDREAPMHILAAVQRHVASPMVFLLALNLFLLAVGCLMDVYTAIIVIVPLIVPIALKFGIDPVHLGIVFLANLAIGYCTPPVGMNLFIASIRFNRPILELYRAAVPFLLLQLVALALITYLPVLSLWLAR